MASKHFQLDLPLKVKVKVKVVILYFKSRTIKYSATEQKANVTTKIPSRTNLCESLF